uniref:Uncharacterized protein n=1 Tax=Hyaloperonospora arabidopsidis (strain Emoy2) TaxID=559515 RepID=M4BZG5_HYAAE
MAQQLERTYELMEKKNRAMGQFAQGREPENGKVCADSTKSSSDSKAKGAVVLARDTASYEAGAH